MKVNCTIMWQVNVKVSLSLASKDIWLFTQ